MVVQKSVKIIYKFITRNYCPYWLNAFKNYFFQNNIGKLEQEIKQHVQLCEKLEKENTSIRSAVLEKESCLEKIQSQMFDAQETLTRKKEQLIMLESQIEDLTKQIDNKTSEIKSLCIEKEGSAKYIQELSDKISNITKDHKTKMAARDSEIETIKFKMSTKLEKWKADYKSTINAITERCAMEKVEVTDQYVTKMADKDAELDSIKAKMLHELEKRDIDNQSNTDNLNRIFQEKKKQIVSEFEAKLSVKSSELEKRDADHKCEIDEMNKTFSEKQKQLTETLHTFQMKMDAEIEKREKEYKTKINALNTEICKTKEELKDCKSKLAKSKEELNLSNIETKSELQQRDIQHHTEISSLNDKLQTEKDFIVTEYKNKLRAKDEELKVLKNKCNVDFEKRQAGYKFSMKSLTERYDKEKQDLINDYQSRLTDKEAELKTFKINTQSEFEKRETEYTSTLDDISEKYEKEKKELRENHNIEIERIKSQFETTKQKMNSDFDTWEMGYKSSITTLNERCENEKRINDHLRDVIRVKCENCLTQLKDKSVNNKLAHNVWQDTLDIFNEAAKYGIINYIVFQCLSMYPFVCLDTIV